MRGCLSCAPQLGTWPATQACSLIGNQTGDALVHRLASTQSTEPHQAGQIINSICVKFKTSWFGKYIFGKPNFTIAWWGGVGYCQVSKCGDHIFIFFPIVVCSPLTPNFLDSGVAHISSASL